MRRNGESERFEVGEDVHRERGKLLERCGEKGRVWERSDVEGEEGYGREFLLFVVGKLC